MLYMVTMTINVPPSAEPEGWEELKTREREYAQELQRTGVWRHLWRVVGEYANVSIFDVPDHDQLHAILLGLPLFPYLSIKVTPLCKHPSALADSPL